MFILLLLEFPVAFSIFASTLSYFIFFSHLPLMIMVQRIGEGLSSYALLAIPFFIMAGIYMNHSGISKRLLSFSEIMTGHMRGGLAQVNIVLSTMMGGLSGSNIADAAMNSKLIVPFMLDKGYSKSFSASVTAASSLITPIIPPGIALILYGYINNVSIGRLFLSVLASANVLIIIAVSYGFSKFLTWERLPQNIAAFIAHNFDSKLLALLLVTFIPQISLLLPNLVFGS